MFFMEGNTKISPWHDIPLKAGSGAYNFVCEIPKESSAKMECAIVRRCLVAPLVSKCRNEAQQRAKLAANAFAQSYQASADQVGCQHRHAHNNMQPDP
jgi:hypothetical protein